MINSKFGEITLRGSEAELMADYSCIIRSLKEILTERVGEEKAEEMMKDAAERAELSDGEIEAQVLDRIMGSLERAIKSARDALERKENQETKAD